MMLKARLYDFSLFIISLVVAFSAKPFNIENDTYLKTLILYWVFSSLYYHLRVINYNFSVNFDSGLSYSLSFALLTGPMGLFIFEVIYRFTIYFSRKRAKTADPGEFFDTFYNIGAFVLINSIAYYLFQHFYPLVEDIPFGFWIMLCLLAVIAQLTSGVFLSIALSILGDIRSLKGALDFIFKLSTMIDIAKVAFTNGLLFIFLKEERWEIVISLFILNYLVGRSFHSKAQAIQTKMERDQFEQMAYTDFLTKVHNRAFMDKKMTELNKSEEYIGIVVTDIDRFKRINDSYNHAVGDEVIKHFASSISSSLNEDEFLFRSGGEEFAIFLRNRNYNDCMNFIEMLRLKIENSPVDTEYLEENVSISYTASYGLYYYKISSAFPIEKAYVYADQLLLESKQLGRNRVSAKNGLSKNA